MLDARDLHEVAQKSALCKRREANVTPHLSKRTVALPECIAHILDRR